MTRKLHGYLLLCFAQLTILSGCQHLPYFGSAAETPHKTDESPTERVAVENQLISSAQSRNLAYPTDVKLPPVPSVDEWLVKSDAVAKKKPNAGDASIVTLEAGFEPTQAKKVALPTPPPLPQLVGKPREYAALVQALQDMLDGRHEEAMRHLGTYDDATQELFLRLLPPLTNLVKKRLDEMTPQEVAVLNKQIRGLLETLIPRSELTISEMKFCKWVKAYGDYQPLPENHAFLTGTESRLGEQVQLYVALTNFESKQTKDGDFLTKLACSLQLHDSEGKKIWEKSVEGKATTHRRRSPMNDFYSNYSFHVPIIPAGTYRLTIHIADETNPNPKQRRTASESLVFRVTPAVNQPPLR